MEVLLVNGKSYVPAEQLSACQKGRDLYRKAHADMTKKYNMLADELNKYQKDAARYGFIRRCLPFSTLKNIHKEYLKNVPNDDVNAQLDAAIDAALAKVGNGE